MKILLIGYGHMGRLLHNAIQSLRSNDEIFLIDTRFAHEENRQEGCYGSWTEFNAAHSGQDFLCALIATPARTHFEYLNQLINARFRNIFVEKPAVIDVQEYNFIKMRADNAGARIVVGYVLRYSEIVERARAQSAEYVMRGYRLVGCEVAYTKDKRGDARNANDMGVFEELYHVFDLIMNGVICEGLLKDIVCKNVSLKNCEQVPDRFVAADIEFGLNLMTHDANVIVRASFESNVKQRKFNFRFVGPAGERALQVAFDQNGHDILEYVDDDGVSSQLVARSDVKIRHELESAFAFFDGSAVTGILHDLPCSRRLAGMYDLVTRRAGKGRSQALPIVGYDKGHCCHNNFIVIRFEAADMAQDFRDEIAELIVREDVDTALILEPSRRADFRLRVFERDGSESDACGNGTLLTWLMSDLQRGMVDIGKGLWSLTRTSGRVSLKLKFSQGEQTPDGFLVRVGEPHIVLYNQPMSQEEFVARACELQRKYEHGINVNLLMPSEEGYKITTYERGVDDITWSCGTGSMSSFVAALSHNPVLKDGRPVHFRSRGGAHILRFIDEQTLSLTVSESDIFHETRELQWPTLSQVAISPRRDMSELLISQGS